MKTSLILLSFLAWWWDPAPPPPAPPPENPAFQRSPAFEWKPEAGGNGHTYEAVAVPTGVDWFEAQAFATAHGGYLATIASAAENEFVFKLIDDPQYWQGGQNSGPWLGGYKLPSSTRPDQGWEWVNNEGPFTYTNWHLASGEPNNSGGGEDHLAFTWYGRASTWNDMPGTDKLLGFVMEFDEQPGPTPPPPMTANVPVLALMGLAAMLTLILFIMEERRKRQ